MKKKPTSKGASAGKAEGAKGGRAKSSAKSPAETPFFRPFSALGGAKKGSADKAKGKGDAKNDAKGDAKNDAKNAGKSLAKGETTSAAKGASQGGARGAGAAARESSHAASAATLPTESDTFALYMAGVRELDRQKKSRIPMSASSVEKAPADARPTVDLDAPARAQMRSLVSDGMRFESTDDGERLEGRRVDVDPRELRRLRRGQYAVDGSLDLHGLSLPEARDAVTTFVRKRGSDGDRVVSIIHGKGSHSPRGVAILRGEIGAWLSDGRAARHVMAFATAPDEDGGTGALLVLLAR